MEVTRFGRTILVIIFGALGVLVLATVVRLRRKRRIGGPGRAGAGTSNAARAPPTMPAARLMTGRTQEVPDEQANPAPRSAVPG